MVGYEPTMKFPDPLIKGRLIKRYKRFLTDVELADGTVVVAHCANSGSMESVNEPGAEVWLSPARNPDRKLKYTWEMIKIGKSLVGINTSLPNMIVSEAIEAGKIEELTGYASLAARSNTARIHVSISCSKMRPARSATSRLKTPRCAGI